MTDRLLIPIFLKKFGLIWNYKETIPNMYKYAFLCMGKDGRIAGS